MASGISARAERDVLFFRVSEKKGIRIKNNKFNKSYIAYLVTKVVFESILLLFFPCISSSY